jgi:hypothetical protein
LTKVSQPVSWTSSFFSSTAASRATQVPVDADGGFAGRSRIPWGRSACTSTGSGRVPEIVAVTVEPG